MCDGRRRLAALPSLALDAFGHSVEMAVAAATVLVALGSVTISAVETGAALARLM